MSETPTKYYLTTPIYYVNARPHIGHAYSTIAADVIARRHRLLGDDTFFLTGTDEHGQKVQRSAAAAGIPPQQYADQVSATFRNLWARMGITNDDYIRTTDERHKRGVQKLWRDLEARGAIYLSSYTGQYSVGEEMFVDGPPGTIGPDGKPTETVTEENYFFKLSEYQQPLLDLIESNTLKIQPEAIRNEVLSFVRGGLKDISISRTGITWGIPVPGNPKHVVYVWLDALVNYITAVGYGSDAPEEIAKFAKYWPADLHLVGKEITRFHCVYWPAFLMAAGLPLPKSVVANGWLLFEESKMSKSRGNVVRTETILDAFGEQVYAKQFPDSTKHERDLFGSDVIRYFLLREIPFGQDGSFSFDALITRYNADLANGYGNLVSRTLKMIAKGSGDIPLHFSGLRVDRLQLSDGTPLSLGSQQISELAMLSVQTCEGIFPTNRDYILQIDLLVSNVDAYLSSNAPWKLAPDEISNAQRREILYTAAESIRIITALLYPLMPYATASVWRQLGLGDVEEAARNGELKNFQWGALKPGTKLGPLAPIFPRADKGLAQIMTNMESSGNAPATDASPLSENFSDIAPKQSSDGPVKGAEGEPNTEILSQSRPRMTASGGTAAGSQSLSDSLAATTGNLKPATENAAPTGSLRPATANSTTITIDDFVKVDLRVAQIVVAERIPKADKLLRLEVDLGPNFTPSRRQILSGIAEWYTPEELIGRRIAVIANLAPRKMRGLESHGMLLAASADDHASKPILASFSDEVPLGSRIR